MGVNNGRNVRPLDALFTTARTRINMAIIVRPPEEDVAIVVVEVVVVAVIVLGRRIRDVRIVLLSCGPMGVSY